MAETTADANDGYEFLNHPALEAALERVDWVFGIGARKYSPFGFLDAHSRSDEDYIAHAIQHILKHQIGAPPDPDGHDHLPAAIADLLIVEARRSYGND